jgi:uncharacterized protein YhaN
MNQEKRNQEIKDWVINPNRKYEDGVELYEKYGSNRILKQSLSKKETRFYFDKVTYELKKLAGMDTMIRHTSKAVGIVQTSAPISDEKMAEINASLSKILGAPKLAGIPIPGKSDLAQFSPNQNENPELELQRLDHKAAKMFTERAQLSNKLRECLTDADRKEIIERLKPLEKAYYKTQGEIKEIQKTGKVKPQVNEPEKEDKKFSVPTDLVSQMKALNNARSRQSKARKKLKTLWESSPAYIKMNATLDRETKYIKQLESIING